MPHKAAPAYGLRAGAIACAGVFAAIAVLAYASFDLGVLMALGSFGSSSVLLFAFPDNHFSQPRSLIGGHVISSAVGLAALTLFGHHWWALGLAVALATALMMVTRTVHPPAGSNPIIVFLAMPGWDFLVFPTASGALALVAIGMIYHRAGGTVYPQYWRGAQGAGRARTAIPAAAANADHGAPQVGL
ncbi:MAG: HPP family protein [Massilia sp.]